MLPENRNECFGDWIDVSVTLHEGMPVWPGNPEFELSRVHSIDEGAVSNVSRIVLGAHTGTHMDAPLHFYKDGAGMESTQLDALIGRTKVIEIKDTESIKPEELRHHEIVKDDRVLFKTENSKRCWDTDAFITDFVYLSTEGARHLVEAGVQTVGVDYLSVGGYEKNGKDVHQVLLQKPVWVIEGLMLRDVEPGDYEMICLPIKIHGSDGAPVRAVLKKLS